MKTSIPDRYDVEARYVPALICSVPFLFLGFYYLNGLDSIFWQSAFALTIGSVGFSTALFLVVIHFCRAIGKAIEEKMFRRGLTFPTTEFMLNEDTNLSPERKAKIISKVKQKFDIDLSKKISGSDQDRRAVHEAVGQIRSMFHKNSQLIQQRNIQFGFTKNLLGGSVLAVTVSMIGVILSIVTSNSVALKVSFVLLASYFILGLASFSLVRFTARHYAHTLYDEFLASN